MYQPAELWYCLKFCKRTLLHQPAGLCCHDNPNYLSLRASFYTGREPLCSLGICISLGQVLKVREMNQNKNTTEKTCACVRKGDSLQHIRYFGRHFFLLNISWITHWNTWLQGQLKLQLSALHFQGSSEEKLHTMRHTKAAFVLLLFCAPNIKTRFLLNATFPLVNKTQEHRTQKKKKNPAILLLQNLILLILWFFS